MMKHWVGIPCLVIGFTVCNFRVLGGRGIIGQYHHRSRGIGSGRADGYRRRRRGDG